MSKWKVIGISGVTCAGKTTLAQNLMHKFENCVLISQDQYFRIDDDPKHEWVDVSNGVRHQNWECLSSVDWVTFTQDIHKILKEKPTSESGIVIIEGHLIFNYNLFLMGQVKIEYLRFKNPISNALLRITAKFKAVVYNFPIYRPISDLCLKKFFITLEKDECLARRVKRTYVPNDPIGYFEAWVWPMYLRNLDDMKNNQKDVEIEFLEGSQDQNVIFETVLKSLEKLNQ